jgi:hypothetical protein
MAFLPPVIVRHHRADRATAIERSQTIGWHARYRCAAYGDGAVEMCFTQYSCAFSGENGA